MTLSAESRAGLAAQQVALVSTLLGRGKRPEEFDAGRLHSASMSLLKKRKRAMARAWPTLPAWLELQFDPLFVKYANLQPLPIHGGPLADGHSFISWLVGCRKLPDVIRHQVLMIELRYHAGPLGLSPRHWPTFRMAWLHQSRRIILALSLPWLGCHMLSIPLGTHLEKTT